jgi:anti-anti-sigma factor
MLPRSDTARDDQRAVVVVGKHQSVRAMRQAVLGTLAGRPQDLVIDLRQVEHLSNQGVAVLVGVRARQRAWHKTLTLVCGTKSGTRQALSRTGMRGTFTTVTAIPTQRRTI